MANEVHVMNVSPKDENRTIRVFQTFGWVMKGNQSVFSRDSHLERRGNAIYNVTKTRDYVKLTFERDATKLKNYAQLRRLENEYYSIAVPKKPGTNKVVILSVSAFMGLIFWLLASFFKASSVPEAAMTMRLVSIACLGLAVYLYLDHKKKMEAWEKAHADCWSRREEILRKAAVYL